MDLLSNLVNLYMSHVDQKCRMKLLELSDKCTHSCKPMIGDKSTGINDIKSDKINTCTQPHESTLFVLKMKIYKGQT